MFVASSLVALALANLAFAGPLKRFSGLSVAVKAPSTEVSSVDELKFTAEVTNNGAQAVRVLKYGTILDDVLPTRSFAVTKDGEEVAFQGIKLSVSLEEADETAYTTLSPGQTVSVEQSVSALYDFESAGEGKFSFEPVTTFMLSVPNAKVASAADLDEISVESAAVEVTVKGDLKKREMKVNKRATNICSNSSRASFISASYTEAKTLASRTVSYISSNGANSLFTAYYSSNSPSTVSSRFSAVANENSSSRTLSCTDTYGACSSGVIAYTVISTTNIYYCSIFFNEVATSSLCSGTTVASRNVRGGTTLHELTHAVAGTDDVTYGCSADQSLSTSNKLANADNYNCFSTQVYQNTGC